MSNKNTEYLNANLRTEFEDILKSRKLKQGEKVDGMPGNVAGVSFNGVNGAVRTEFRNDHDVYVNYDANEHIESIDFNRPVMADFHFYA